MAVEIFTADFLRAVQQLIERHHTIYPRLPPQGLFFEALVQQAFHMAGHSPEDIVPATPNSPQCDLSVGGLKLSIKSETGKATKETKISITKLCTTETGEWTQEALVKHALAHLRRHDKMLMVRAIWEDTAFEYQLLEVPLDLLARMKDAQFVGVGTRRGRGSLAADVTEQGTKLFRIHFDGADGKCQVHGLLLSRCRMLGTWKQLIS